MGKESLITIFKEASRYVVISLRLNIVARRHLRARYDARCARDRYGDTLGDKGILWRSEDETRHFGRQKDNGILFVCFVSAWATIPRKSKKKEKNINLPSKQIAET
jgi:hypothetical protein